MTYRVAKHRKQTKELKVSITNGGTINPSGLDIYKLHVFPRSTLLMSDLISNQTKHSIDKKLIPLQAIIKTHAALSGPNHNISFTF